MNNYPVYIVVVILFVGVLLPLSFLVRADRDMLGSIVVAPQEEVVFDLGPKKPTLSAPAYFVPWQETMAQATNYIYLVESWREIESKIHKIGRAHV